MEVLKLVWFENGEEHSILCESGEEALACLLELEALGYSVIVHREEM